MATPPQALRTDLSRNSETLPLVLQEVLTVIERLRANRQRVTDPEAFRGQIRSALKAAERDGLRYGYTIEDLRVGTFAIVAFLDESILNSHNPLFADWPRKPLQEELFGVHIAGEIFFRNLERLLGRPDSEPLADLLEVHQLCLLLGFRGRYSASGTGEIRSILAQIEEKIARIRAASAPKAPISAFSDSAVRPGDRFIPMLRWLALACAALALVLFVIFKFSLSSGTGELQAIAAGIRL